MLQRVVGKAIAGATQKTQQQQQPIIYKKTTATLAGLGLGYGTHLHMLNHHRADQVIDLQHHIDTACSTLQDCTTDVLLDYSAQRLAMFKQHFFPTVHAHTIGTVNRVKRFQPPLPPPRVMLEDKRHGGLTPLEFRPFRCSDINVLTPDTCIYYFNLSAPNAPLNLPVCSYVLARTEIRGEQVIRPYTPLANFTGELPILVKTYPRAKMGSVFANMEVGDTMYFKGPFETFEYKKNDFDRVTLIAAGTGVSPMMQLIDKILTDPSDRTKIHLIYGNKTEQDILLARELQEFATAYPNRLKLTLFIDKAVEPDNWTGLMGHISKEVLMAVLGKPHPHSKVFVSMPPGGMEYICGAKGENYTQGKVGGLLAELGFTERDVWKFWSNLKKK